MIRPAFTTLQSCSEVDCGADHKESRCSLDLFSRQVEWRDSDGTCVSLTHWDDFSLRPYLAVVKTWTFLFGTTCKAMCLLCFKHKGDTKFSFQRLKQQRTFVGERTMKGAVSHSFCWDSIPGFTQNQGLWVKNTTRGRDRSGNPRATATTAENTRSFLSLVFS